MGEIEAQEVTEERGATVRCYQCNYWGIMSGWIDPRDTKFIEFVCPACSTIERVRNFNVQ